MSDRSQRTDRPRRTLSVRLAASAVVIGALAMTGCTTIPEISEPYTPGAGANASQQGADLRSLVIVTDGSGKAVLTGAGLSYAGDAIIAIGVQALDANATPAGQVAVEGTPVKLPPGVLVQLGTQVGLTSPKLVPGLLAQVSVTFSKAGMVSVKVPVYSTENPDYKDVVVG